MNSKVLFFLFCLTCYTESYKILVVYPLYVKSLNILGEGIVRHLLKDGNEVTYITTHPMAKPPTKNFRQIDLSSNKVLLEGEETLSIRYILDNGITQNDVLQFQELTRLNSELTFGNKEIIQFLKNTNETFDAVLVDLLESEVYAGLSVLYDCPMVWVYSLGAHWQVLRLIADPSNPSYDPDYLGTNMLPFTFTQRIQELWARLKWSFLKTFITKPMERELYEKTFGPLLAKRGRELPDYEEVIFNASLIFGNEHNAISNRPSTPQNFKYVGGFHIEEPVKPLPKDLQDLMDNAPHGVIYFSMGSFWKSKEIPMVLTRALLNMFGELKQTVIWKYEDELKDLPKNVHTVRWAPQPSILAHPNCKFFISHGGLLSSIESVHFGVPVIGIPIFMDQFTNINRAVAHKYAIKVDLNYDLPNNLKVAIDVMLNDESFRKNVKELSAIYHDTLTKPGEEVAHWVRHVIRTRGAPHLRSPAHNVPLYQRLYLDFAAVLIAILLILRSTLKTVLKSKPNRKDFNKKKKH